MIEHIVNIPPAILLLAGNGTRLAPLTNATNKNLLPIYDKPLVLQSLDFLEKSGIKKIIAVVKPSEADKFVEVIDTHKKANTEVYYAVQEKPLGTANGLLSAEKYLTENSFFSLWGDNVFEFNLSTSVSNPLNGLCRIHLTRVKNPQDFGVVEINRKGKITKILDKPKNPKSNLICTGFMGFKSEAIDTMKSITPNNKGEYDVMDTIRFAQGRNMLEYALIRGRWLDAGVSFDTLLKAAILAREKGLNKC